MYRNSLQRMHRFIRWKVQNCNIGMGYGKPVFMVTSLYGQEASFTGTQCEGNASNMAAAHCYLVC